MRWLKMFAVTALAVALAVFFLSTALEIIQNDDTLPEISCESETLEIPCDYTTEQLLEGMTAYDEKDGDLTSEILVGNFTRFIQPGYCRLNYIVFDSDEHMATLTRDVYFTDYTSPQFSLSEPLCFPADTVTISQIREMFSANDRIDGNITPWISYIEGNVVTTVPGDYTITMEVTNSFGDTVRYEFPVHIYDGSTQDYNIALTQGMVTLTKGATFDPFDYVASVRTVGGAAVASEQLNITSNVDMETPGIYEVHYEMNDSSSTWLIVIVQEDFT